MGLVIFSEGKYIDVPKCYGENYEERSECHTCPSAVKYQCGYRYNDERY
jgi:hypothetical protein